MSRTVIDFPKSFAPGLVTAVAVSALTLFPANTASANHIDFFDEGDSSDPLVVVGSGSDTNDFVDPNGDTILGQTRRATVTMAAGVPSGLKIAGQLDINPTTGNGVYSFGNDDLSWGTLTLEYGLTSDLNLVNNPAGPDYQFIGIDVFSYDEGSGSDPGFRVDVTATDTSSNTDTTSTTISSAGQLLIDYDSFDGVDFTSLDDLTFDFVSLNPGADLVLDAITREVPEPTTAGLLALGGLSLLARRRR